jgi:hypothetical protein
MTTKPPTEDEATVYMEMCAALISLAGKDEIEIGAEHLPMEQFSIWRRFEKRDDGDVLIVRLVREGKGAN